MDHNNRSLAKLLIVITSLFLIISVRVLWYEMFPRPDLRTPVPELTETQREFIARAKKKHGDYSIYKENRESEFVMKRGRTIIRLGGVR